MKALNIILIIVAVVAISSCNQPVKESAKEADSDHQMAEMKAEDGYTACQHASKIYWKGTKPTGEHNGIIKLKEGGTFIVEDGELTGGSFVIDMTSIMNIDVEKEDMNAKLVEHLKSPDFFNVDSFPTAVFDIVELAALDEESFDYLVKGNLTMKDIVHPIEFKANVKINDGNVSAISEEFALDRTLWGINYKSKSVFKELKDKFIGDKFFIKIEAYSM